MKLISMIPVGGDSHDVIATVEPTPTAWESITGKTPPQRRYRGWGGIWSTYPSGIPVHGPMETALSIAYRREIEWKDREAQMHPVSFPFLNRSFDEWAKISATLKTYRIKDAEHLEEVIRIAQGIP